jgi:long-chain acyl-CoA synthetase
MSVPETLSVPLAALPDARAAAQPDAPAIADDAVELDNAAFADRVARAAALLARLGVGEDDVVAVALPNRLELVIALFAAWRLGAAATPVNPALTRPEMQYQVDDAGSRWTRRSSRSQSSRRSRRSSPRPPTSGPTRSRC